MQFAVNIDAMEQVQASVSEFCQKNDLLIEPKACVCSDEIVSNIIRYSGAKTADISLSLEPENILVITFTDDGIAFNPLEDARKPDLTSSAEERQIGGLGIYMVRKMSRSVTYERKDNLNILTVKI